MSPAVPEIASNQLPDCHGHFGPFGGMFVPETLMSALDELDREYRSASAEPAFQHELDGLLRDYAGRPTPLYFAERLTERLGGAKIYLKREDLLHTGAHKINNALGQILLARRHGQKADHRGDWRRPARGRDGDGLRAVRLRVRGLHGRGWTWNARR